MPGLELLVQAVPSSPDFFLITKNATQKYIFKITEAHLDVAYAQLSNAVMKAHQTVLEQPNSQALYDYKYHSMLALTIAEDLNTYTRLNVFQSKLPKKASIVLLPNADYFGKQTTDACYFKHYDISRMSMSFGNSIVPAVGEKMNFRHYQYGLFYQRMVDAYPLTVVDYKRFLNGNTVFCFDFSSSLSAHEEYLSPIVTENVTLDIDFQNPTPHVVTCLILMEFDDVIEISQARVVTIASENTANKI
mgnify:CR=1 FL=1